MGVPLLLKDASGNLQEFTTGDEAYLSYLASLQLLEDSAIGSLNTSSGTSIGSYSNTFFNEAVGTHPSTSITTGTTTTTVYQNLGTALEDSADWRRPLEVFDSAGFAGIKEMDDTSLNAAVDRYLSYIFTNDLPGSYKLASSAPAGYTAAVSPVFTDTRTDGTSIAYSLYRRTSFTPPTTKSALHLKRAGDSDQGAYEDGIQEMTVQEMKTTFGQRAKTRINASGIGKYKLRTSGQGAPTDPGTWVAKGTATDTRQELTDQNFTRESTVDYIFNFTRNSTNTFSTAYVTTYTGNFIGNYVNNFLTDYLTDYATVYEPAAYVSNFTRNSTTDFTGDFLGNFIGNYVGTFTRDSTTVFTGDFLGNFVGNYEGAYQRNFTRDSTSDFTGDFLGNYIGNFVGNYVGTFTRNSTRTSTVSYLFQYVGQFQIAYNRVYARDFIPFFQRINNIDFVGDYFRNVYYVRDYVRDIYYARNFIGNYARNFTRTSLVVSVYTGGTPASGLQGYTGGNTDTNFATQIIGGNLIYYQGAETAPGTGDTGSYLSVVQYQGAALYSRIQSFGAAFLGAALYVSNAYVRVTTTYAGQNQAYESNVHDQFFSHNDFGYGLGLAYVGAATTGGEIGYTRQVFFEGNYARNFAGNYLRVYLRAVPFSTGYLRQAFSGNYIRAFEGNYAGGNFIGNFQAGYVNEYARDFTVPYDRGFVGDFIGNYDRNFTRDSTRDSTRNSTSVFTGNFVGDYAIDYLRNFTRDSTRNSTNTFTGNFIGNYDRNFTRDSTRNSTSVFTGDFLGNYQSDYVGTYEQLYTIAYQTAYESAFTRDSTANYDANYVNNYTGDFTGDYQRAFTGNFIGDFAGETIQSSSETIETYTLYVRVA